MVRLLEKIRKLRHIKRVIRKRKRSVIHHLSRRAEKSRHRGAAEG
jgi:hypothetical protein